MEDWSTCTSIDDRQEQPWLPPGFRFHPTDEELVTYYLAKKIQNVNFTDRAIAEADLNKCEPWELPGKAQMGEKECYFYSLRDRKYPTGMRTNRATNAGYWKATGKDRDVMSSKTGRRVGMKKTLVFYRGRAPKGEKTNWVMHEYRVEGNDMCSSSMLQRAATNAKDEWVVCRIFQKSAGGKKVPLADMRRFPSMSAAPAHHFLQYHHQEAASLPALLESPPATATVPSTAPLGPFSTGVGASIYNPLVSPSAAATYQLPPFSGTSSATATATSSSHAMFKALVDHYSLPCKPEPYSFDPSPFPSSANINNLRFPDLAHYARLPALATENLLSSYTNLFATPPPPSQQQPHQQHQQQQQISLDGMAASLSQDALSDTCGSADLVPNNAPQLPRFPSDLDSLWAYSDH